MLPGTTDVLVVGAGPTGLTVAVSLAARSREVTVVDSQAEGQNTSRASVIYPRTLEVLEPHGVTERLAARGIHARQFTIRDRDRILMTVPFGQLPTAYPYTLLISQAVTEAILLQRLSQLGGQVLRPCALASLDQDATGVTASFDGGEQLRAGYLVGADGMHSTVREQARIGFSAGSSAMSYSLADVHLSGALPADEVTVFLPGGTACLRAIPRRDLQDRGQRARGPAPARGQLHPGPGRCPRPAGRAGDRARHRVGSRFRIHHGVADAFHAGRVALAGDAAHDNSPLGGQGMNAGIGDAVALAGALERGSAAPLNAYSAARRPVASQIVRLTNGLTRLATMDRQLRTARNATLATLSPFLSRPLASRLSLAWHPLAR